MPEYRDYGQLGNNYVSRTEIDAKKYSQVFLATHKGESYLPFMERSFISFSFGGKNIEEFNLIATFNDNYLQKNGYSQFEDITSDYNILNGHFYWGTHYTDNQLSFSLSTDEITQKQLEQFLAWFSAGKTRELILSEHPNRAIMARVFEAPSLKLFPFEKKTSVKVAGKEYQTSTTLYRGGIGLTFVMEEPFWYSKINIFGYLDGYGIYHDVWTDANGISRSVYDNKDAMKIVLEDNIPISGMIQQSMLLGDNKYANKSSGAQIAPKRSYQREEWYNNDSFAENPYAIATVSNGIWIKGAKLTGTIISETEGILNFSSNTNQYFYYAGNAPSVPIIKFTLTPHLNSNGYIDIPANSYATDIHTSYYHKDYNTIFIESLNRKELNFTTPSVYTAYNQAIKIFKTMTSNQNDLEIKEQIRDKVNHPAVRAWANRVIDDFPNNNRNYDNMQNFLKDGNGQIASSTFTINNKTGEAIGELQYRNVGYSDVTIHEEDVGDMICSNHLIIEDRNQPTEDGNIVAWDSFGVENRLHSHRISHDVGNGLKNFFITYKNMYL